MVPAAGAQGIVLSGSEVMQTQNPQAPEYDDTPRCIIATAPAERQPREA